MQYQGEARRVKQGGQKSAAKTKINRKFFAGGIVFMRFYF